MMRNQYAVGTSAAENLKAPLVLNFTAVHGQMTQEIKQAFF